MPPDGSEPINDDEILYRRIPVSQDWYDPRRDERPSPEAFRPQEYDTTGISLSRNAEYKTIEAAGRGRSRKGYYVAEVRAGELRKHGIEVVPRPEPDDPGHVEIPAMNYAARKSDLVEGWKVLLAEELCLSVHGPFLPERD